MNYSIMNFIFKYMFEFTRLKCKQNFQDNEIRCKDGKKHAHRHTMDPDWD